MPVDDQPNISAEYGVFSPPEPLPNEADLSNGAHGEQLRYGKLNFTDAKTLKQFNQVLAWLKTFGAPTDDYIFFTPILSGGFGSTQIIFSDGNGQPSAHDATILYNDPETAAAQLRLNYGLPVKPGGLNFPGFGAMEQQSDDPVGPAIPAFNTPGWARPFPRYCAVAHGFDPAKWPRGSRFLRVASDEEYVRDEKMAGFKPRPNGFGMIVDLQPVWERIR